MMAARMESAPLIIALYGQEQTVEFLQKPLGIEVQVWDYDITDIDESFVQTDENGQAFWMRGFSPSDEEV